jgi:hypothetical protein
VTMGGFCTYESKDSFWRLLAVFDNMGFEQFSFQESRPFELNESSFSCPYCNYHVAILLSSCTGHCN